MKLDELNVYRLSMEMGEMVWGIVEKWNYFERDTIGKQLVRASDSVAANIAEGYGRYYFKENKQFCYYSRGSLFETKTWIAKAKNRQLINDETYHNFENHFNIFIIKLNNYIKSIGPTNDQ